jgi:esterase/lipase superfamily enzyme
MPRTCIVLPLLLALASVSCAASGPEPVHATVELPFVTNRAAEFDAGGDLRYANDVGTTTAGRCELRVYELPDAEVVVERYAAADVDAVLAGWGRDAGAKVTLYIHGYNIGLERGCRDAAVLARKTGWEGRMLLFSWPASRTVVTYHRDAGRFVESMPAIVDVLEELGRRYGRSDVNIVAHSMGSRIVDELVAGLAPADERFGKLMLIAPDVERDRFVEILPGLRRVVDDITVLVSDSDQLLLLSQAVNLGERLGQSDDVDVDGVAIIDVTGLDNAGLGNHVYHLTNEAVGKAIGAILDGKAPPDF